MAKKTQQQKRLDEGLNLIFRSKNRQIMLSRIHEFRQFSAFYHGHEPLQVITPTKATFLAKMTPVDDENRQFLLDPIGERPALKNGEALLLLFQAGRHTALSQATVSASFGGKIRVNAVDPRSNIRYKTRMRVLWHAIGTECFERFGRKDLTVARHFSLPETMFKPPEEGSYLVRDLVCGLDGSPEPLERVFFSNIGDNGLMVDLSVGGFCMLVESTPHLAKAQENLFIIVDIPMAHITYDFRMQLIAVVRHVRTMDEGAMAHCMFVERLDPDVFNL